LAELKVGINGLGVLGRRLLRMLFDSKFNDFSSIGGYTITVAAVNDVSDPDQLAYLLKYDTVYGVWDKEVSYDSDHKRFVINGIYVAFTQVAPTSDKYWSDIPWNDSGVEYVFDCTGAYTSYAALGSHTSYGAKLVIGLAQVAFDNNVPQFCFGINESAFLKEDTVVGIPATQCYATSIVCRVLNDLFTVICGTTTDVGSYTNLNNLQDSALSSQKTTPQNGRAGAWNLIYSGRSYAKAIGYLVAEFNGKITGQEVRSGTIRGAMTCGTYVIKDSFDIDSFLSKWKNFSSSDFIAYEKNGAPLASYTGYSLVSSDMSNDPTICFCHNAYSTVQNSDTNQVTITVLYDPITVQAANAILMAEYIRTQIG